MKRIAATLLMAGVLGLAPGVAFTEEDRIERSIREARELQARQQKQAQDADAWLRSPTGEKWQKSFQSTQQEPMTVVGPVWNGGPAPDIRSICAQKWPDNYHMQLFCVKEETKAQQQLDGTYKQPSIAETCADRWPDNNRMRLFCIDEEARALGQLNNRR